MLKHAGRNGAFCNNNHVDLLGDVLSTFIDKIDLSNPLKREKFWKQAFPPKELNKAEYVQQYHHNVYHCFVVLLI